MQKINIAIDGYSSCGKSTIAKELAKKLGYLFIDTGAMYRAITLYAIQQNLFEDEKIDTTRLVDQLDKIQISFSSNNDQESQITLLNSKDVSEAIRTMEVSEKVSIVAAIKEVRSKLVEIQREIGKQKGVVMDGRDIGSVVFPDAELKLFITANVDERVRRRTLELQGNGVEVDLDEVKSNLLRRDKMDMEREESPLIQTKDAVVIDNTNLTRPEQLAMVEALVALRGA